MAIAIRDAKVVKNIFRGRKVEVYRITETALQALRGVEPESTIAMADQLTPSFLPKEVLLTDGVTGHGATKTLLISDNSIETDDSDKITVIATELIFDDVAGAGKILIGANATETAANAAAAIDAIAGVSATSVGPLVTVVGDYASGDFVFTKSGSATEMTIATTVAYVQHVGASREWNLYGNPIARTGVGMKLRGLAVGSATNIQDVLLMTDVTQEDEDNADNDAITARVAAIGLAIQTGSGLVSGSYYWCTDPNATKSEIDAAVQAKYGTDSTNPTAFAATGSQIVVTALPTIGAQGNSLEIGGFCSYGPATEITFIKKKPQLAGVYGWGYTTDLELDFSTSSNDILTDQKRAAIAQTITASAATAKFIALCDEDGDIQRAASGFGGQAFTGSREQFLPNVAEDAETHGFLFVTSDGRFDNQITYGLFYDAQGSGVKVTRKLRENGKFEVNLKFLAVEGGEDIGFISRYRPAVKAA